MRILITTECRGTAGGIETYLRALAPGLIAAGHELSWLFGTSPWDGAGASDLPGESKWIAEPAKNEVVRAAITDWKPDVIYAHGLLDLQWDKWLIDRYSSAFFAHGYFGACISGRKCHSVPTLKVCRRALGPKCLLLYLPLRCGGRSPLRMLKDYRFERQRQRNLQRFRVVMVASQYMADEYLRQGVPREKLRVMPLFSPDIAPDRTPPEPRAWSNSVLMAARLTDLKGAAYAAEAVAIASRLLGRTLTLVVAGEGPGRMQIAAASKRHDVPTEFLGWLGSGLRNEALRQADVLLVPSVWPEPFGLVGIEAGCVGLPAVAFDVGGISDWLTSGYSGELAASQPPTAAALGAALAKVLSNREEYQRMRHNAWSISQRFTMESHLRHLLQVLESIQSSKTLK